jgi:hypothetical protein
VGSDQLATTIIKTSVAGQQSMPTPKTTATSSTYTQLKPTPLPGKSAAAKDKKSKR